jgi:predicted dehydrogenase
VDALAKITMQLLARDIKMILVEKPVGLNELEVAMVAKAAKDKLASVYAGYNRRFYSSVLAAKDLIEEDGGVLSFQFEFTEWSHVIEKLPTPLAIKKEWFLANSTHVIDLAFYLGGVPQEFNSYTAGGLDWHPTASIFTGAGITTRGALFSYQANWEGPGRWGVEVVTKARRYIFRPLEKLNIQQTNSVIIENYSIDDFLDTQYKPGLYRQVEAFISSERATSPLLTIEEHVNHCEQIYIRIQNKSSDSKLRGEIDNESQGR